MNQEYKTASTSVNLLEMKDFTAEHIRWLQEELKKPNNFIWDEGRRVMVNTQDGIDTIDIPSKEDKNGFLNAWLKVYNTCLATLDIDVKIICLKRNHVRKTYNQIVVGNFKPVMLPENTKSVTYVVALEQIINNYKELYNQINSVKKSNNQIKVEKHEVTLEPAEVNVAIPTKNVVSATVKPEINVSNIINFKSADISKPIVNDNKLAEMKSNNVINFTPKKHVDPVVKNTEKTVKEDIVDEIIEGQKIPDGDKLTKADFNDLKEANLPFVLVTCTHLDKDENTFMYNAEQCMNEGLTIGAYLNGKATDAEDALKDSKKILRLLKDFDIKGPVIYELNLDYLKSHDSEENIDNIIKAYNGVASVLTESGYHVLVATDLDTGVLLERQIRRKNIPTVYPMIYRVVPREMEQLEENVSYVLMDPQYDNDIVKIVNPTFKIEKPLQMAA